MYRPLLLLLLAAPPSPAKDFHGDPLPPGALARMGTVRLNVGGRVFAFSPDEKLFGVVSSGGEVWLWSVETGLPIREMEPAPIDVLDAAFSADGSSVLGIGSQKIC